jgi:hypothetical protein
MELLFGVRKMESNICGVVWFCGAILSGECVGVVMGMCREIRYTTRTKPKWEPDKCMKVC